MLRKNLWVGFAVVLAALLTFTIGRAEQENGKPLPDPKAGTNETAPVPVADPTIFRQLEQDANYSILVTALKDTGVNKTLSMDGKYTFFAPTNEAFEKVPKLAELLADKVRLGEVLRRHVIVAQVLSTQDLVPLRKLTPMEGKLLDVNASDDEIEINDAKIVLPDRRAGNGVYHGIDHVLMKNNDSMLGEAGGAIERGLKDGAEAIEDAFNGDDHSE